MGKTKSGTEKTRGGVEIGFFDEAFQEILYSDKLAKLVWDEGDKIARLSGRGDAQFASNNGYRYISNAMRPTALIHAANDEGFQLEAKEKRMEKATARCADK